MPDYFAYGSNLDERQMADRCPSARLIAKGCLADHGLRFSLYSAGWGAGVADIVESPGEEVWGLLFSLTELDSEALDRFEGVPRHYQRVDVPIRSDQRVFQAFAYRAAHPRPFVPPSRAYLQIIQDAARRHDFPEAYNRMLDRIRVTD